jgi:purine-nucleoside phosphorylase
MSIHISANPGEIAPFVLMPGDPLRAKYIAETMLDEFTMKLVSSTRNIYFYTGEYRSIPVTIGASGMGCPSIGIYSFELYNDYDVQCIIRAGTCGAYRTDINLYDLINVETAYSESTYAQTAFGYKKDHITHQGNAFEMINLTAKTMDLQLLIGPVHSGDAFYRSEKGLPKFAMKNNCLAAEMEAFALFANARYFDRMAATLLTVSDIIPTKQIISAEERERSLDKMAKLALESVVVLHSQFTV